MPTFHHPISDTDAATMAATRALLATLPSIELTPAVRPSFDEMIRQVPPAAGITYEREVVGGVSGWWCRVPDAPAHTAILYLHGGGYVAGSSEAYRHPVGQIAAAAGVSAFVAEYGLAPEKVFPAAFSDAVAAYQAMIQMGFKRIAIVGDSAGGGLTLAVLRHVTEHLNVKPVAAVAISPWTDMTASGPSMQSRAASDPLLDKQKLLAAADLYLARADAEDHRASPLFGQLEGLPPTLIHVGEDEVLLDDAVRYAERAQEAGSKVDLHVWAGMIHVFTSSIASLVAAREATDSVGTFLAQHLIPG